MSNPASTSKSGTLLVADDEVEISEIIKAVAEDLGFVVTCVNEGLRVVDLADRIKPDLIALDLRMPGADGVEIIRELGKRKCKSSIILMSGMDQRTLSSVQSLGKEHNLDIASTLTKPMSVNAIEGALRPFLLTNKKSAAEEHKAKGPLLNYGLSIGYEPEFTLKPVGNGNLHRLKVTPKWRKDGGEVLTGTRLAEWSRTAAVGKGLSKMVLASALETLRVWGNQGFSPELAIKLDSHLLLELDFPDILAEIVDRYFVPRELIAIEIEEATITGKQNSVVDVLSRLRIKGFKLSICVDREGETIMPMINNLPVDHVVLDMEYMARKPNFLQDMEVEFLYSSLTSVTNHKGISVCAANVDSSDILTFVMRCNFNSARGTNILAPAATDTILPMYTEGKFSKKSAAR